MPRLRDQFVEAGLQVEVSVSGAPAGVPEGVDLSAYRIVQEGLTNVLRHGGPSATVAIGYEPGLVRVDDRGRRAEASQPADEPGHGLIGMRERVAVFGGTFSRRPAARRGLRPPGDPAVRRGRGRHRARAAA